MGKVSKRTEGAAEELVGRVKKAVGRAIGNEQMQVEGRAGELRGEAKQQAAKAAERAKGVVEEVAGTLERGIGRVIDNEQLMAEGLLKQKKGSVRRKANR